MEYELTTLNDVFHKVPADKIMLCLKEIGIAFVQAALLRDEISEAMKSAGFDIDPKDVIEMRDVHTWIDDGKGEIDSTFSVNGDDVLSIKTTNGPDQTL